MRRRGPWIALIALVATVLGVVVVGVTDAFGTGAVITSQLGGWSSDGAAAATFWDSPLVDMPGASLTGVHCHGSVQYELQLGATGPGRSNPCYAAMGEYSGGSSQVELVAMLPGDTAIYRLSDNYGPWRYCIGKVIHGPGPAQLEPATGPPNPC